MTTQTTPEPVRLPLALWQLAIAEAYRKVFVETAYRVMKEKGLVP